MVGLPQVNTKVKEPMMSHMASDSRNNSTSQNVLLNNAKSVAKNKLLATNTTSDGQKLL